MWVLHVVVVQGQQGWQTGLLLWLLVMLVGGGFAGLSGEWRRADALLADLALAAAGGALANAGTGRLGSDPLALIFDVRVFWTALGSVLALGLAHDALYVYHSKLRRGDRLGPLGLDTRGGFLHLLLWLTGWPSEPGTVEATYDGGLIVKLMPDVLYYQAHKGPLTVARAVPLLEGLRANLDGSTLRLEAEAGSKAAGVLKEPLGFGCIAPHELAVAIKDQIARRGRAPAG